LFGHSRECKSPGRRFGFGDLPHNSLNASLRPRLQRARRFSRSSFPAVTADDRELRGWSDQRSQALDNVRAQCAGTSLVKRIDQAIKQVDKAHPSPTINQLQQLLSDLDGAVRRGELTQAEATQLRDLIRRVIASLGS